MEGQFSRTERLLGAEALARLRRARVAVFGIGGVGGYAAEALARSGVGALDLVDADQVAESNLNRQIFALHSTLGRDKVDAARERLLDIAPDLAVTGHKVFFGPDTAAQFDFGLYDYVVDAIDTVSGKIELVLRCRAAGVPIISAMGAGNKLDPTAFRVSDIAKTSVCPLARVMRRELKKRGVDHLKTVWSPEPPLDPGPGEESAGGKRAPGSCAFVPPVAGLILAGEVIKDLARGEG